MEGVTSNGATLSWTVENEEFIKYEEILGHQHIDGFILSYKSNHLSNRESSWHSVQIGGSLRSFSLRNLKCGTPHTAKIEAFNRVAKSDESLTVQFATKGTSEFQAYIHTYKHT